jgi:hypothetical protein
MSRLRFALPLLVVALLTSGVLMGEDKKKDKEPIIVNVKLPTYFSKLGLTAKQRQDVLKIRAKYTLEIQKLRDQITALQEQQKGDEENVLTAAQKARLRELRGGKNKEKEIPDKPADIKKK